MTNFVVKQFAVQLWLYYVELCSQKSKLSIKSQIDFFVFLFCSLKSNQRQKHTQKISITNRRIHFLIIVVDARKRKAKLCFQIWMTKKINKQNSFLNLLTLYSIPFWSCWSRRRSREKWRKNKDEALLCFTPPVSIDPDVNVSFYFCLFYFFSPTFFFHFFLISQAETTSSSCRRPLEGTTIAVRKLTKSEIKPSFSKHS